MPEHAPSHPPRRATNRNVAIAQLGALAFFVIVGAVGGGDAKPLAAHQVSTTASQRTNGYAPGQRTLLDAHNAYPEDGKWADRIDRALATGVPLAIEQDLFWHRVSGDSFVSVVAHDSNATNNAPTFEHYFFDKIAPIMERALKENRRASWPLIVLNLDFKTDERAHHQAIYALLGKYERWLTTTVRTATPDVPALLTVGPLLVLSGQDSGQRVDFHDAIAVGKKLRVFGAIPVPPAPGATREERARNLAVMSPSVLMTQRVTNYARWVNFPWGVVEEGGQTKAGAWTADDSTRLTSLVTRAHANGLWIRFYTLDGFAAEENMGYTASYNFGNASAALVRWRAVKAAHVDFVATDQYAQFAVLLH